MAEVPPVYVQFKGDTTSLNASIGQAKKSLVGFGNTTQEVTAVAKKLGVAQIALGGIIANVATAAAANVKSFAMSFTGEYQAIAGEVRNLSKVMDGTPEQLSAMTFAAKRFGIDSTKLSLGIRTLSKHLATNDKAAQSLGITFRDANGQMLPTTDIIYKLADRFKEMPSKLDANAYAMQAFGRAGKDMALLLGMGSEGLKKLGLDAAELGMIMSGADLQAVKEYSFAQKDLKHAIDGVKVTIGRDLLPILSDAAQKLNESLLPALKTVTAAFTNSGIGGGIRQTQDSLQQFILGLDGIKSAIYQVVLMIASFKIAMFVFNTAPAVFGLVKTAILGVKGAMEAVYIATLMGSAGFKALAVSIRGALISTGIGVLVVILTLIIEKLINAYITSETFRNKVNGVFRSVALAAVKVANAVIKIYNAFAKLIGLKGIDLISLSGGSGGGREDIASAYGFTPSGQQDPFAAGGGGGGGTGGGGGGKGKGTPKPTIVDKMRAQQQTQIDNMRAKLSLAMAQTEDLEVENKLQQAFKASIKKMYDAAVAMEKKTRGTKNHAAAQAYLNDITQTYAGAIESANSAQKALNDSIAAGTKLTQKQIDEQNRMFAALQRNRTANRSWLAATSKASGPTQANFGGFIEVPVVIDGQTVFRATQRYSLINNQRNVTNGLATSGSLI